MFSPFTDIFTNNRLLPSMQNLNQSLLQSSDITDRLLIVAGLFSRLCNHQDLEFRI